MDKMRKPFQGVVNIIRFNWHFFVMAFGLVVLLLLIAENANKPFRLFLIATSTIVVFTTFISLLISYYVYDLSGLYDFKWLDKIDIQRQFKIVNINAGFDETSSLLKSKFINSELTVLDFYNPKKHTEISIKRARKAYPPCTNTLRVETSSLPLADCSVDKIFAFLSVHEIRDKKERHLFFKELYRVTQVNGQVFILEHMRDIANFLAYNIGAFHFHTKKTWLSAFYSAGFMIKNEVKITPFITLFILEKNGITS